PFAANAVEAVKKIAAENGHEVALLEKYEDKAELLEAVKDVNALIVRSDRVDRQVIDSAPELKVVARAGAGYDNIDIAACDAHGVIPMNTPGQNANAVAELVITLMFYMSRNQLKPGKGTEIAGKKIGIQAFGNVGSRVAKKCVALGMTVYAYDAFVPADVIKAAGVIPVSCPEELYEQCDFVSIHVPKTHETVCSIGYDLLSSLPKGACVINTARREVVNEIELCEVLEERPDLKYATDLACLNQAEMESKFGVRVFATPKKMGAETEEANYNAAVAAVSQICEYFKTGEAKFQVHLTYGED
ncbi:MAG: NAD(P)-binding domain-containing protein, partial [Bacteroidales bacterium]|nr:NAD(P)-binding domain-containing protein [Bacteroidales bacterium]